MKKSGYIYIIRHGESNLFKVGRAGDVGQRAMHLQCGNPFSLTIENNYAFENVVLIENKLHKELREYWIRGEWYQCKLDTIQNIIETHIKTIPKNTDKWNKKLIFFCC